MVSLLSSPKLLLAVAVAAFLDAAHAVEFFAPNWVIPMEIGTPYPSMTVNAGDSLTFAWSQGTHDVWIYPSGTCNPTDGIQIATVQDNPTTYTFSEEEAGTSITFVCDVGAHCQAGMIMDVVVLAAAGEDEEETSMTDAEEEIEIEETPEPDIVFGGEDLKVEENELPGPEVVTDAVDLETATGEFSPCNVCYGENGEVTQPDFVVTLPNPGLPPIQVTCAQLFQDGMDGFIPEASCSFISQVAASQCGCVNLDFTCKICGEDINGPLEVRSPDTPLPIPSDPTTTLTCGELASAGANGELSVDQCGEVSFYAQVPCQCTPVDFSCSICGEGYTVNNPDAVVDSDDLDGSYTCAELEQAGLGGVLSPMECAGAESLNRMTNTCGCVPTEGYDECLICGSTDTVPFSADFNLTVAGMGTNTCDFFYEAGKAGELGPGMCFQAQAQADFGCNCASAVYTCDVCGGGNTTMLFPEYNFTVPSNGALVNCGVLAAASGITPEDCSVISPLVQAECGCAPSGYTCNICGDDSQMTITEADVTFIPGEETTCAGAQAAGLSGEYAPLRCEAITPFAQVSCGCEASGTVFPVLDENVEDEIELGGEDEVVSSIDAPMGEEVVTEPEGAMAPVDSTAATDATNTTTTDSSPVEEAIAASDEPATTTDLGPTETMANDPVPDEATDAVAEEVSDAEPEIGEATTVELPEGAVTALEGGSLKSTSGSATSSTSMATMTLIGMVAALIAVV